MIDIRSLVDRVYEYLLNQIVTGEVKYGDAFNIKKIAMELNVSSMPVREALKRLEFEHIVSIKPRSSCRILKPSSSLIRQVCELREIIEMHAVTSNAGKIDSRKLNVLASIVEKMRKLDRVKDVVAKEKRAIDLDREFHSEICSLAENDFMNDIHRQLSLHVNMTAIHERTYHKLESKWAESHAEIVRCLKQDPKKASKVMKKHFDNFLDLILPFEDASERKEKGKTRSGFAS
jgi:DNA-binding GntR family transcriptional regulator